MKNDTVKLQSQYPSLKFEYIIEEWEDEKFEEIRVTGFNGNADFELELCDEKDITNFRMLPVDDLYVFKDLVGINHENSFQVLLRQISLAGRIRNPFEHTDIQLEMGYKRNELNITISLGKEDALLLKFLSLAKNVRAGTKPTIVTVNGFIVKKPADFSDDCKSILNSVLFDLEYNFNILLEPVTTSLFKARRLKPKLMEAKGKKPRFVFKNYIPELIEYYRTAERVDYLPFKYLCYFHIIEYFLDKSAYNVVSQRIKDMMLKPDFDLKIDHYVMQAINVFKKENDKFLNDKAKISRVLMQFIDIDEISTILDQAGMKPYFSDPCTLKCNKELKLSTIDFFNASQVIPNLTSRIYSLRCSIVHSNPDFDDEKAVPFLPTTDNLAKLDKELLLIREVAKAIILKSAQN